MIQFLAKSTLALGVTDRWSFPCHLLHKTTALALSAVAILFAQTLLQTPLKAESSERPNIVYILADDMGFSDIGCYGSEVDTPNLDALAGDGIRFTQFYNTARCCPTRASLLTGLYPHQAGVGHMMNDRGYDGYRGDLNRNCMTIAEVLGQSGYRTYMAGKWHVTKSVQVQDGVGKHNWPLQRGFDRFYGTIHGAGSFFDPNSLTRGNQNISPAADPEYRPETFYYTDAISDHAVRFINEHHGNTGDKPFFMYVAYTAAHWPMHALEKDLAKYKGKYDAGYQAIRDARYKRMIELGLIDAGSTVNWSIPDDWKETEYLDWDIRNMEVYAAMIDNMDQGIGRIVQSLKATGQFDNTLICFLQDNGGCAENYGRGAAGPQRAAAPPLAPLADDFLQPDMQPRQTRDGYPVRVGKGVMSGPADTYIGYGRGWATVSNTPFREYKHWTHEGGIATPLIAHWPNRISRKGQLEKTPGHLIDLMATAVDVAGAAYPVTFHDGQQIKPMEGKSLVPAMQGQGIDREALYWEHEGNRAVRRGDYKLVAKGGSGAWELYNIADDRSEQHDLSSEQPERTAELAKLWQAYAERANVLPLNPGKNQKKQPKMNRGKRKFQLKQGDRLSREQAPFVQGRGFSVSAKIVQSGEGVIAAQGGTSAGWSLYVKAGELFFATTVGNHRRVVPTATIIENAANINVELSKTGELSVRVDGTVVATAQLSGPLDTQPLDGLDIGSDTDGNVGDYNAPFEFTGKIGEVTIMMKP